MKELRAEIDAADDGILSLLNRRAKAALEIGRLKTEKNLRYYVPEREAEILRRLLADADLAGANLAGAMMPDGRRWEAYRLDHLAGICTEPEVVARAVAAWGTHQWSGCPMHAALGIDGLDRLDDAGLRRHVACWVALYDAGLLDVSGAR